MSSKPKRSGHPSAKKPQDPNDSSGAGPKDRGDETVPDPTDVIDLEEARRRVPDGQDAVRELARLMIEDCPKLLEEIRAGVAHRDSERLQRGVHTLRGSAEVFGAKRVVAAARRLADIGPGGKLDDTAAAVGDLEREVDRLSAALRSVSEPGQRVS